MSYRLTILGCGPSGGVPRIGPEWGACDPANPKNRRRRCSALIERKNGKQATSILVDTSPDLREQLISVGVMRLDAVLYTHDHADHTHGIDDLRQVAYAMKRRVDIHADDATRTGLVSRFGYCFETQPGSDYAPILNAHALEAGKRLTVEGAGGVVAVDPFAQMHGDITSLGFRVRGLAYSPDISNLPPGSVEQLQGLDVWIVDALRYTPHPSHFHVKRALEWIERIKPRRAILTHMTTELDYATLKRDLPAGVEPAYDGLVVEFA
jgi:phosphoribosyl 1,2-cyclic phosphate phosphodiesterase